MVLAGRAASARADAAALAGVVYLPSNFPKARQVALQTAERNGAVDGVNNVSVAVTQLPSDPRRLRVEITDSRVESFLGHVVLDSISMKRAGTAEYVLPVPLGSPASHIGTGNLNGGSSNENYWLAVSGWCASKENGDLLLARHDGTWNGSWQCSGIEDNAEYNPAGYYYAIDVGSQAPAAPIDVELYDAGYSPGSTAGDSALQGGANITTTYVLRDRDGTPFDDTDNPVLQTTTIATNDATWANQWRSIGQISVPQPNSRYILQVYTEANQLNSWGSNSFAVRAHVGSGAYSACSTITGAPGYSAACPQVHGVDRMSILANLSGSQATLHLADVGEEHAGKKMVVRLFDPGEGAQTLEVLDPNLNPVDFTWTTPCNPPTPPGAGCSGSGNSLNVSGTGPQPGPNRGSNSPFSDRSMDLTIDLPGDYAAQYGTATWWRIRYTVGSSPTDRTTWSVVIIGDPVHLVHDG